MAFVNDAWLIICQLYLNCQWFITDHPPLVLFAVCIMLITLILSTLAFYVASTNDIRNPDVSKV